MYRNESNESFISNADMVAMKAKMADTWNTLQSIQGKLFQMNMLGEFRVCINKEWGRDQQPTGMETVFQGKDFGQARFVYNSWQWKYGMLTEIDPAKFDTVEYDPSIVDKPNHNVVELPGRKDAKIIKFPGGKD